MIRLGAPVARADWPNFRREFHETRYPKGRRDAVYSVVPSRSRLGARPAHDFLPEP